MSQRCLFSSLLSVLTLIYLVCTVSASPSLHPDEVEALKDIASTLGVKHLNLSEDPCLTKTLVITQDVLKEGQNSTIRCDCRFNNNNTCHITHFILKTFSLPGRLPPELAKLQYLKLIDLCRNFLNGSIPMEWAALPYLTSISVCANRLSEGIPKGLGKFINLTKLDLEANQFSGTIPMELGNLVNLEGLILSSNQLVGGIPKTIARLKNLTNIRFSDNSLSGSIPELMGTLAKLQRLELYASGLTGPIPDSIFQLENLFDLRISDTTLGRFPHITSKNLEFLVLRNMNLTGPIPTTIWDLPYLMTLDLSFNRLTGEIPADAIAPKYTYLAGNMLSGKIESGPFLTASTNIDLSYNNFTWSPSCRERTNVNTYKSSSSRNSLTRLLPCSAINQCNNYSRSLHINCGGPDVTIKNPRGRFLYEGDKYGLTGSAMNYHEKKWGFSNTGDFMDDVITEDTYSVSSDSVVSAKYPELYQTARRSPLSLAYFAFCFQNGSYNVKLHFAEIQFSDEEPYARLAKRFFNIYVQGKLIWEDFNIREEANGTHKEVIKEVNTTVTDNTLEIRLYWAGKGTTIIPKRGNYGSLISAISVCPSSESECGVEVKTTPVTKEHKPRTYPFILVVTALILSLTFLIFGAFYWRKCVRNADSGKRGSFSLKQLKVATDNFDLLNKIGEGGFGSVYKGRLPDGTLIAVKKLSSKSCQGNKEFVNEIGMIACLQHPNLVKLYGCCCENNQLLLVYEYLENNCLADALFGRSGLKLEWGTRHKICVGIARGLTFLHEDSAVKIIHRDIKGSNVLLDKDLNSKISDFGLARLHEDEKSHITTRVAGTIGYMAPEYAMRVIFAMPTNKSPGPDGFPSEFFKTTWPIVASDFVVAVQSVFRFGFLPKGVNSTILALVPKKVDSLEMRDFRPIACCNVLYKVVSKIIANRLKGVLPRIVLENQSAFIKGRLLMENVLLASELVKDYHKEDISPRCVMKIDISKAFDSVQWDFVLRSLEAIGVPARFIHWVKLCITTPSFSVQVNGELGGYFQSKRGLRQGCSLSPYLFVLCMNVLSHKLDKAAKEKKFMLHPRCQTLSLTHLCFADDLMVFVEGTKSSIEGVLSVFEGFTQWSGLSISIEKSTVYMAGVQADEKGRILRNFPFAEGVLPVRYLGLPLMTKAMRRQDYIPLIEKIRSKISSWKSRFLSYAGRLQLIKSVLTSIANFWAAVFRLPSKCMKEIEQICSAFLWTGPDLRTSGAKVAWKEICTPKNEGGLGIRALKEINLVYGLKLIWRLLTGGSLWGKWVKKNLIKSRSFWEIKVDTQVGSWMWRKLLKLREIAKKFYRMEIGNGRHISYWYDRWSEKGVVADLLGDRGFIDMGIRKEATLAEAALRFKRKKKHRTEILNEMEMSLNQARGMICNDKEDVGIWRGSSGYKQRFTTSETWQNIRETNALQSWTRGVWFSMGTPRFAFIVWLAMKNRLATMDRVSQWSRGVDVTCVLCNNEAETREHLFFKCSYSAKLWSSLARGILGNSFSVDWLRIVQKITGNGLEKRRLFCLRYAFHAAIYALWRERNRVKHGEKLMPILMIEKFTDKGIRNKLSLIRMKGGKGMENALQFWFQTRA